jgi:hypothetical protein
MAVWNHGCVAHRELVAVDLEGEIRVAADRNLHQVRNVADSRVEAKQTKRNR